MVGPFQTLTKLHSKYHNNQAMDLMIKYCLGSNYIKPTKHINKSILHL